MEPARLKRAETIFHDLIGQDADSRANRLEQECGGDLELRELVERMLAADRSGMGQFLERPACLTQENRFPTDRLSYDDSQGQSIGGYEIVRKIGEGGMGIVFEARQSNPRRMVALKLLRFSLPSPSLVARFQNEAHVLAQLRHPGIAHIYEAAVAEIEITRGITAKQPYFVMELVEGLAFRRFADERRLGVRKRLELMIQLCDAVQHAHEKGVIHRDLKPDNVLVDASSRLKVLDFGVARLTAAVGEGATLQTRTGDVVGTPAFMSPEQVAGDVSQTDTRSDIYSLGVILYELLTDRRPHDVSGMGLADAAQRILNEEPKPPSSYRSQIPADVDWVVMKCLEKDRERRYASAAALADDIRRYLADEPVLAGPPGRMYQFRKLVRRNRGIFSAVTAMALLLLLAVAGTTYGLIQARHQRDAAEAARQEASLEEQSANAIVEFLTHDLLGADDSSRSPENRDERISDVVNRAERRLDSGAFANQPKVEAAVRNVVGHLCSQLGRLDDGLRHCRRALELYRASGDPDESKIVETACNVAEIEHSLGHLDESAKSYSEALVLAESVKELPAYIVVTLYNNYAELLRSRGDLPQAEAMYRKAQSVPNAESAEVAGLHGIILSNVGELQRAQGKYQDAVDTANGALELLHAAYGNEHPSIATVLNNKALALQKLGKLDVAESLHNQALAMRRRLLPPEHSDIAQSLHNLASVLRDRGRFEDAEPLYRETLVILEKALPQGHFQTAMVRRNHGHCLLKLRQYENAEHEFLTAFEVLSKTPGLPPGHVHETIESLINLYNEWANDVPESGATLKSAEWRAKLAALKATTQPPAMPNP